MSAFKLSLCFDNESFDLELNEFFEILHSKIGEPMRTFIITSGDTAPVLRATLLDKNGDGVPLTAQNIIKFIMRQDFYFDRKTEQVLVQDATNISIAPQNEPNNKGKFQYNWQEGDTDCPGSYCGLFQITLNGIENGNAGTYIFTDGMTLEVSIDQGSTQIFTFNTADFTDINEAQASEIVAVINATITDGVASVSSGDTRVLIQSLDTTIGGSVQVLGGTANDQLLFETLLTKNRTISLPDEPMPIRINRSFDQE